MTKSLKNVKNEKCTLKDLEYGKDIQDQVDSLAEVVLQNRRGLDLLTADKGGICLALQEKCRFYTNKSGIVRNRIRKHQEELEKRRKEFFDNPM